MNLFKSTYRLPAQFADASPTLCLSCINSTFKSHRQFLPTLLDKPIQFMQSNTTALPQILHLLG